MYKYSILTHLFLASEIFMLIRQLSLLVLLLASAAASTTVIKPTKAKVDA